jgi:hypothetical protein
MQALAARSFVRGLENRLNARLRVVTLAGLKKNTYCFFYSALGKASATRYYTFGTDCDRNPGYVSAVLLAYIYNLLKGHWQ